MRAPERVRTECRAGWLAFMMRLPSESAGRGWMPEKSADSLFTVVDRACLGGVVFVMPNKKPGVQGCIS